MPNEIKEIIRNFVKNYSKQNNTNTDWEEPLLAFASADDPLFLKLKEVVSETHSLPNQLLPGAQTVISFFIPFESGVVLSNVDENECSKEWALAYIETNKLIDDLNKTIALSLSKKNYNTVLLPPTHNFDEKRLISDWSHKHVAYIAGLGNFGLHKMLITEKGSCGRLGSVITNAKIDANERNEEEYCLYFHDKSCRKCVEKCIFDALKIDSFNRNKCYEVCLKNAQLFSKYGFADVCGKCLSMVPCSLTNPVK